ncbi:hypothetical protein TWF718_005955 [Orbilia javanica]|uniref:Uncharacterized protein n=1 Tax=Orbilia javanica TaxID=47235 RepID=A0AAN8NXT4_9PEZI
MTDKLNFELAPKAGTFVTRDVDRSGPIVKLYFFPGLRAQELGVSNLEVAVQAMRSLLPAQYQSLNVEPLLDYLNDAATKLRNGDGAEALADVKDLWRILIGDAPDVLPAGGAC